MRLFHLEGQTYVLDKIVHVSAVWGDPRSQKITVTMVGGEEYQLQFGTAQNTALKIRDELIVALESL